MLYPLSCGPVVLVLGTWFLSCGSCGPPRVATGVSSYPVPALSGSRLDLAPAPWFEAGSILVPSCGAWFLLPSKVGADYFHTHVTIHWT